jgi:hypothetical protein
MAGDLGTYLLRDLKFRQLSHKILSALRLCGDEEHCFAVADTSRNSLLALHGYMVTWLHGYIS